MIQLKDLGTFESVPHIVTDIVTGNITLSQVSQGIKDMPILFPKAFKATPRVFVTVESTTINYNYGSILAFCSNISTTGFTLRIANASDAVYTPAVNWMAIAT